MDIEKTSEFEKPLSDEEIKCLQLQDNRTVSDFQARMLEVNALKHWDLFYKRNEAKFFKDRHWTTREFEELLNETDSTPRTLLEVGCGVGNFIFPLIEENSNFIVIACDLSPRAVEMVKSNSLYNAERMRAFQCDITTEGVFSEVQKASIDIATLIFVLSAIHPDKFLKTLENVYELLKPGGILLLRDYGLYDMAQLRFKPGHKIAENFYMRQDGTRSYYFSLDHISKLLEETGFHISRNTYVHRRTVNKKENIDVPRIFVQCKATKPA
nr:methyltransferase-like protein 6 [Leptinotarsa decemlineata]